MTMEAAAAEAAPPAKRLNHRNVVETLGRRIIDGVYPPGALLPAVELLADELGVSRTVVREALRVLSARGFIASRQRAGTQVRQRTDWRLLDPVVLEWLFAGKDAQGLGDSLLVLRRILEPEAAALAATNATGRDIDALEDACRRMRENTPSNLEETLRADVDFHVAMFAATGNVFLEQFAHLIKTALLLTFEQSTRLADSHAEAMELHAGLAESIRRRDASDARRIMGLLLDVADKHLHNVAAPRRPARQGGRAKAG